MTKTPTKTDILTKAIELFHIDRAMHNDPSFSITPTEQELKENGYLSAAQSELMRDNYKQAIESKDFYDLENFADFQFDIKEGMQTTTFISGSRGVGKSDIAMQIVDQLTREGITCIVFDSSRDWFHRSSTNQYVTVQPHSDLPIPSGNMIFDLSLLTPSEQQQCVERFCKKLFEHQINNMANKYYIVFEEAQLYFPLNSIRAKRYQNSARVLTVGRNVGISLLAVSQFPALCDKELIKNAQQIYIGCTSEPNTLAYWKGIFKSAEQLKDLQNGEFLYYCRNKLSRIQIEPYENNTPKRRITIPEPQAIIPDLPKQTCDTAKTLSTLAVFLIYLYLMFLALSSMPSGVI